MDFSDMPWFDLIDTKEKKGTVQRRSSGLTAYLFHNDVGGTASEPVL